MRTAHGDTRPTADVDDLVLGAQAAQPDGHGDLG
jgi:hypothetical protein